jgi:hypothetical protein
MNNPFQTRQPAIDGNQYIRVPQREAYDALSAYASSDEADDREVGIILPVGCGKSGCITLSPFAFRSGRTLVVGVTCRIVQNCTLSRQGRERSPNIS